MHDHAQVRFVQVSDGVGEVVWAAAAWASVLLRFAYLAVTNAFAALRLLPVGDRGRGAEILALRHQIAVLGRRLGDRRPRGSLRRTGRGSPRCCTRCRAVLRRMPLTVRPDTVMRWHRDLVRRRHARCPAANGRGVRPLLSARSGCWSCASRGRTRRGATADPRRTGRTRHPGRGVHGLGDPRGRGGRSGVPTRRDDLGRVLACTGRSGPCLRLHRDSHAERTPPVHPRRHRARHPAHPCPRRDAQPDRRVGGPSCSEPGHGPRGRGRQSRVPDPRPGWQVPQAFRRGPRRRRHPHPPDRRAHTTDERGHGALGPHLPP